MSSYKCNQCGKEEDTTPIIEDAMWATEGFIASCRSCGSLVHEYRIDADDITNLPFEASCRMLSAMYDS